MYESFTHSIELGKMCSGLIQAENAQTTGTHYGNLTAARLYYGKARATVRQLA